MLYYDIANGNEGQSGQIPCLSKHAKKRVNWSGND